MTRILCLLLFASQFLLAQQRNVALLHVGASGASKTWTDEAGRSEIPFEMAGGMIVVKASVNGEEGNFIFDTGAPGIVLNALKGNVRAVRQGASVGGGLLVGAVEVKDFQLGIIRKEKSQGHLLDVHHLEIACGMDIMGLIGYDVLKNYELLLDFPNKKIQTFKSGEARNMQGKQMALAIPFTLCGHVPVIVAKVGNKRVFLGLDSGAEVNLLDRKYFDKIGHADISNATPELLTGLDNIPQEVLAADVQGTKVRGESLPEMRYVFADLSNLRKQFDAPLDGLLGIPFFKDKVVSIDYRRKMIYIWE